MEVDIFVTEKFFQDCRAALVVEALEFRSKSSLVEFGVEGLEGSNNRLGSGGFQHRLSEDAVAVIII